MYDELKRTYIFNDFHISIQRCGKQNAFSDQGTGDITICTELWDSLHKEGLDKAIFFIIFHEMGHTMLDLWGLPLSDNEDAADEFSTIFLMMIGSSRVGVGTFSGVMWLKCSADRALAGWPGS